MATSVKQLLAAANATVPRISPHDAAALMKSAGVIVVDVRDALELRETGKVAGALNISRGTLEFHADPASPTHDQVFDKARTVIVYCSSGSRAALAGKTLQDLGYQDIRNVGGIKDWIRDGCPVEKI
jgi:rhodanese-related sulfurtransferase